MKWKGRPSLLADQHVLELLAIVRILSSIPSPRELAKRWGVSEQTVRRYLRGQIPKRFEAHRER